jgi:gentisate 1,2-dioxygenase
LGPCGIEEGRAGGRRAPPHAAERAAHPNYGAELSGDPERRAPQGRAQHGKSYLRSCGGHRTAIIGDLDTAWERGDVLATPSWTAFEISAAQDALLFEVSDEPVLQAFNFLRNGSPSPP